MTSKNLIDRVLPQLRDELHKRREARLARRQLERDLASYQTPGEINELLILIGNQDTAGADEVRDILSDNLAAYAARAA